MTPRRRAGRLLHRHVASASAARRARSPARSGTSVPDVGSGLHRRLLRQHGRPRRDTWRHVAFIEQRTPTSTRSRTSRPSAGLQTYQRGRRHALADGLRRLQALHPRRLPRGLPDRRAVPHRVRHGRRAGGRLQRLRLLRAGLPVRRASTGARTTGGSGSARSATTGSKDDLEPACAKACPTDSIQFGELDELRERADARLEQLQEAGVAGAQLYGADEDDGVGGFGAFFLLLDEPEVYGLPPDPVDPTRDLGPRCGRRGARGGAPRWRASAARSWEAAVSAGRARDAALVLRPAGHQGAGLDAGDPALLLRRRPGGRVGRRSALLAEPRRRRDASRAAPAAVALAGIARQPGAADLRPRPSGALPEHAADVQGHLADERRLLGPRRRSAAPTGSAGRTRRRGGIAPARGRARAGRRRRCSGCRWRPTPAALIANTAVPVWHEARRDAAVRVRRRRGGERGRRG